MINQAKLLTHQIRNAWHTFFLFALMSFILMLLAYIVIGTEATLWAFFLCIILLIISPKIPPQLIMKMYSARLLFQSQAGKIHQIVNELSRRAGLKVTPQIYYIPSNTVNAFSIGSKKNPAIGITEGLINVLSVRELIAVLAHEISHIYHNDMMVMSFADIINRVATLFSLIGIAIFCILLPFYPLKLFILYWPVILILFFSPLLLAFIQLRLSRTREYSADIEAVSLTGDAEGLAMALNKLKLLTNPSIKQLFLPRKNSSGADLLRTHPKTEERVKRLMSLNTYQIPKLNYQHFQPLASPSHYQLLVKNPRWHISGLWY
jgi:heat shock protein HtpX